jgi:hypothetical protein
VLEGLVDAVDDLLVQAQRLALARLLDGQAHRLQPPGVGGSLAGGVQLLLGLHALLVLAPVHGHAGSWRTRWIILSMGIARELAAVAAEVLVGVDLGVDDARVLALDADEALATGGEAVGDDFDFDAHTDNETSESASERSSVLPSRRWSGGHAPAAGAVCWLLSWMAQTHARRRKIALARGGR